MSELTSSSTDFKTREVNSKEENYIIMLRCQYLKEEIRFLNVSALKKCVKSLDEKSWLK